MTLRDELQKPEYKNLTDQEVADLLNAKNQPRTQPALCRDVKRVAIVAGYWSKLVIASEPSATTPVQVRALCISALEWIKSEDTIDFELPAVRGLLSGLVATEMINPEQAKELVSLGQTHVSIASELGYSELGAGDVGANR